MPPRMFGLEPLLDVVDSSSIGNDDCKQKQESRAVAKKPRDAAAVLFGLKFVDNIHYKFKSISKLRKPSFRAPNTPPQNRI